MRAVTGMVAAGLTAAWLVAAAEAGTCYMCGTRLECSTSMSGGALCSSTGITCATAFPCGFRGGRDVIDDGAMVVFVTLHEDDARDRPLVGAGGGRRVRGYADPSSLDEARRAVGEALGRPGGQRVVSGRFIVSSRPIRVAFRSPRGDGWGVHADPAPGGVRVSLRETDVTRTPKLCARETLADGEALVARVRVEGRPYLAVMRARVLRGSAEAVSQQVAAAQQPFLESLRAVGEGPDSRWVGEVDE